MLNALPFRPIPVDQAKALVIINTAEAFGWELVLATGSVFALIDAGL